MALLDQYKILLQSHIIKKYDNLIIIIIIIVKIAWSIELEKGIPYEPEGSQNHYTKQAVEQQEETEVTIKKYS